MATKHLPVTPQIVMADHVRYERAPQLDKRIANGDDYAGDAWVRWTAVGRAPDDLLAAHAAKLTRDRDKLVEALQWIIEGYNLGEDIHGPKIAHGIAEARAALEKAGEI